MSAVSTIEPTLRELRRQRARADIAATAIALFREHGYDATTVDQIA
ncbi:MAG: TetR/AcrR family transcriptional regulator, partial [Acidimicrobiia bacterium]|nr:TetR/AcrR family transcriptional regulator [Acidimicrobiia bacterium]